MALRLQGPLRWSGRRSGTALPTVMWIQKNYGYGAKAALHAAVLLLPPHPEHAAPCPSALSSNYATPLHAMSLATVCSSPMITMTIHTSFPVSMDMGSNPDSGKNSSMLPLRTSYGSKFLLPRTEIRACPIKDVRTKGLQN